MQETRSTPTSHQTAVYGYASLPASAGRIDSAGLREQTELIAAESDRLRLRLIQVVVERESAGGRGHDRPGLGYVLKRIAAAEGGGLIVCHLSRLTRSVAELGAVLEWFLRGDRRLISVAEEIDTTERSGLMAVRTLVGVFDQERRRLTARTGPGLEAARSRHQPPRRPSVADDATLAERIRGMRQERMSLREIADRLNAEGVPTVRGGAEWRPSSLQSITGYRRRRPELPWEPWRREDPRPAGTDPA